MSAVERVMSPDKTWVVWDANGRVVSVSDYRPFAPKGGSVKLMDRDEGCALAHAEWFPDCTLEHDIEASR